MVSFTIGVEVSFTMGVKVGSTVAVRVSFTVVVTVGFTVGMLLIQCIKKATDHVLYVVRCFVTTVGMGRGRGQEIAIILSHNYGCTCVSFNVGIKDPSLISLMVSVDVKHHVYLHRDNVSVIF